MSIRFFVLVLSLLFPFIAAAESHLFPAAVHSHTHVTAEPLVTLPPSERADEPLLQRTRQLVTRLKELTARIRKLPDVDDYNASGGNRKTEALDEWERVIKQFELAIACADGNLKQRINGQAPIEEGERMAGYLEVALGPLRNGRVTDYDFISLGSRAQSSLHPFFLDAVCKTPANPELDQHVSEACRKWGGHELFQDPVLGTKLCKRTTPRPHAIRLCYDHAINVVRTLSRPNWPMPGGVCLESCLRGQSTTCQEGFERNDGPPLKK